jgi:hypothetical protein
MWFLDVSTRFNVGIMNDAVCPSAQPDSQEPSQLTFPVPFFARARISCPASDLGIDVS